VGKDEEDEEDEEDEDWAVQDDGSVASIGLLSGAGWEGRFTMKFDLGGLRSWVKGGGEGEEEGEDEDEDEEYGTSSPL